MSAPAWGPEQAREVQTLALAGYNSEVARHFVLRVADRTKARQFLAALVRDGILTFGARERHVGVNIGFTCAGLEALGVDQRHLRTLAAKAPSFAAGAPARATRWLGDAGDSAVAHWDKAFAVPRAQVWIAVHASNPAELDAKARVLRSCDGAEGLEGWNENGLDAARLAPVAGDPPGARRVHFGYRDGVTKPTVLGDKPDQQRHRPGELLLCHPDDNGVDFWSDRGTPAQTAEFLRGGSFGVLRKIEQHVEVFEDWLEAQSARLRPSHPFASVDYLKAKLCGRWPNGALVLPGQTEQPDLTENPGLLHVVRATEGDRSGTGCPFGAHIRRTNPGKDPVVPPGHHRVVFRRGLPYGTAYGDRNGSAERGLMGVFFCASIQDQFETIVSEWVEKSPLGLPDGGDAKDPLVGHNDDVRVRLRIPLPDGRSIELKGWKPFVRTRGTLYALFPSRSALLAIAGGEPGAATSTRAHGVGAAAPAAHDPKPDPDAANRDDVPVDRFCDIVMEGGITSGIIYTTAVARLARHYRFRGIAGSSIGAFAAALTAAAELQRRQGSTQGFDDIAAIPDKLAQEKDGRTLLERLFNPQPGTRRLFEVFRAGLGKTSWAKAAWFAAREAQRQYCSVARWIGLVLTALLLVSPLLGLLLAGGYAAALVQVANLVSWLGAVLLVWLVAAIGGPLAGLLGDLQRGFLCNGFGLCRGWGEKTSGDMPDLCGFLHAAIQKAAGRDPERDPPLTFRDLWNAPGAPADVLGYAGQISGVEARSIDLQVHTTNLAHGRLYRFPLDDPDDPQRDEDMGRLFFRADELRRYFPDGLVKYLVAMSHPYSPRTTSDPPTVKPGYFELPAADLPVVVAVRLAMSFPGLISALPLHAIDYRTHGAQSRVLRRCWMSDGGLCSNFPIHLFDSWIPAWPTFGIALMSRDDKDQRPVWLPQTHRQGRGDLFDGRLESDRPAFSRLGGFVALLWLAAWRWNDRTLMRMPGVRDRVVRVFLLPNEGGINIRMSHDEILGLARDYGGPAADAFIRRFADAGSVGWSEHRWVRFMVLLTALRERVEGIRRSAAMARYTVPLAQQIDDAESHAPLSGGRPPDDVMPSERPIGRDEAQELRDLLAALERLELAFAMAPSAPPYLPMPRARLRLRHSS